MRAEAYDVALNGYELGGGSIRIHESDLQTKMFGMLSVSPEEEQLNFRHILEAFKFGAPPHGGLALGLDHIREVNRLPEEQQGARSDDRQPDECGLSKAAAPRLTKSEDLKFAIASCVVAQSKALRASV